MDILNTLILFIGSYTLAPDNFGIYVYSFNQNTGESQIINSYKIENPSYLSLSPCKKTLFALQEVPNNSIATSYSVIEDSALKENNTQQTKGGDACFIANNGKIAINANYSGGSLSVFPISESGGLLPATQVIQFTGNATEKDGYNGLRPDRQQAPHLHSVYFSPCNNYIFVADLGNDCIYRFNLVNDTICISSKYIINTPFGSGPRHIAFSKDGGSLYLINEISGTILLFSDIYKIPKLEQEIAVVPKSIGSLEGTYGCADIHLSPCGNYLYASQRVKNDGVAIFKVGKNNVLERIGFQPTGGHPRNFTITPNGKFLLVASRDNNNIEVYNINNNGLLERANTINGIHKPVCIIF